jgi:hypothetical protein
MTAATQPNRLILSLIFSALFLVAAGCSKAFAQTPINGPAREGFSACENNSEFVLGDKVLANNVWNRDSDGEQCVFPGLFSGLPVSGAEESDAAKAVSSWIWNWPHKSAPPKSYPNLTYGFKPWRGKTTLDSLPVKVSALQKLDVTYAVSTHARGSYNTSFDLWLTRSDKPKPEDVTAEIMIWLDSHKVEPAGHYKGIVEIEGAKYGLWIGRVQSWKYVALKAEKPSRSGSLKLKSFFNELQRRRVIDAGAWLSDVELGNEITSGKGRTVVTAFNVIASRVSQ